MAVTLETSWKQILTFTETIDGYSGNIRQTLYAKYSRSTTQLNNLQSTISWELRTKVENGLTSAYYGYNKAYSITSKETSESSNTTRYSANINQGNITTTEKVLASGEWTQNHSSNGTCNVKINYSGYCYSVLKTGSVDVTLPNIAVNPTLTITSVGNMTTSGASVKYTLGNTNGRSTKIQYSTNGTTWVDWKTKTADGTYTETLPNLLSSYKDSYTNTIYFRAYISSTISSGSKSKGFSIDPSIKANISSVTVTADNGSYSSQLGSLFVQTISKPKIKTNGATAGAGATLKQYDLTALSGYNAFSTRTNISAEYTYPTEFQKSGSSFIATVRVKDSRGDASAFSKSSTSFKVVEYYNPSIQNVKVQRCTSNGTLSDSGTYCKLTVTYKIAPIPDSNNNNKNSKSLEYKIGSGSWTTISISSYNTTITQVIGGGNLSTASSYEISVRIGDIKFSGNNKIVQTTTLPTSFVLVSKHTGGKGIAFGKIAESDNFECALPIIDRNGHKVNEFDTPSSLNFTPKESERGTFRVDVGSSATGLPSSDGFIATLYWYTANRYDTQVYFPNNDALTSATPKYRCKANGSSWGVWHSLGEKEAYTVTLSSNTTLSVTTTYSPVKIPLNINKFKKSTSNLFTLTENGEIQINRAGNYLVSGNIMGNSSDTTQTLVGHLAKVSGSSVNVVSESYMSVSRSGYLTIALTPIPITANAGDKIYLALGGSKTGNITVGGGQRFTYMTIMEL